MSPMHHVLQVDPAVSAEVYHVRSLYYKYKKSFADFYKSSLLYLAFISSETLPQDQKLVRSPLQWWLQWPSLQYATHVTLIMQASIE